MTDDRRTVQAGDKRGHLLVIEELEGRARNGLRRFTCRCLVERDGAECGRPVVKTTKQLNSSAFRACNACTAENTRRARRSLVNWSRAGR